VGCNERAPQAVAVAYGMAQHYLWDGSALRHVCARWTGYGTCEEPQQNGEFTTVRCLGPEEQLAPGQVRGSAGRTWRARAGVHTRGVTGAACRPLRQACVVFEVAAGTGCRSECDGTEASGGCRPRT